MAEANHPPSDSITHLIDGYRQFQAEYTASNNARYLECAAQGQCPKYMVVGCCDSRVNPAIITRASLGNIFQVHNVANLVPPYHTTAGAESGIAAALEFAVNHLKVEHVIVLGHSNCGGIRALMESGNADDKPNSITKWMTTAAAARQRTCEKHAHASIAEQAAHCERESLSDSLANLHTYPWVAEAMARGVLLTHAWHFDIASGNIERYCQQAGWFVPLVQP